MSLFTAIVLAGISLPAVAEISSERRNLTERECTLTGNYSKIAMQIRQGGYSLDEAMKMSEISQEAQDRVLEAYQYPLYPAGEQPNIVSRFAELKVINCFQMKRAVGEY